MRDWTDVSGEVGSGSRKPLEQFRYDEQIVPLAIGVIAAWDIRVGQRRALAQAVLERGEAVGQSNAIFFGQRPDKFRMLVQRIVRIVQLGVHVTGRSQKDHLDLLRHRFFDHAGP